MDAVDVGGMMGGGYEVGIADVGRSLLLEGSMTSCGSIGAGILS